MPIYAYRCEACGFEKDVLQKMSDAPLTQCPECQGETFRKQVTAAGFQLKGSGWYVTDFRGGSNGSGSSKSTSGGASGSDNAAAAGGGESGAAKPAGGESSTAASSPAPAASSTADA
ncbi:FmdB family zinc ribbon protein [Trinickia caryophylli]|uniref:Putative regulatory protein, FmdB family n=1 Tax=Trinickia caryophylli TaxID=28094 RepID=A0A1X7ETQ8_TRICW|nr:FmdB family zinc ribbon protein [Trinickia caryophylli]PMS12111.1 FmdB family transcriptional regulator [Trinickia caryophylli]TRX18583.1 zinc ribbon domain-containing protein [Trinickia caryophylli]WQE10622.1 FmdB family zinc ribbon protein [Trinickia caryophylli]SMF39409.1 putative regulatory protein, FmdB family [Trinickia caryophylli]GLU32989.1 hypothetical protein Busp01_28310 [Trinickia caryophylli]